MGFWSKKELSILKEKYSTQGRNIPELLTSHTIRSVQMKASELKIGKSNFNKWTEEELNILKEKYPLHGSNIPVLLISRSPKSIGTKAKRLHLHYLKYKPWNEEDVEFFKKNVKIMPAKEIANRLKRKLDSVRNKASALRISSGGHIKSSYIKNVNIDFFKTWSEDMAYILGLWFADGNLEKDLKRFSICSIDIELLDKIKRAMKSEHPLGLNKKGGRTYRLAIGRKEMCKDILSLGGTPCKSLTAKFPKVPREFIHHFIRGNFDGDGSISLGYKGSPHISFLGTKEFLQGILDNIELDGKIKKNNSCRIHYLQFSGLKAQKVLKYMYSDSHIYLERKHKRYIKAMEWEPKMSKHWARAEDEILREKYPIIGYAVKELLKDRQENSIHYRAKILGLHLPPRIKRGNNPTLSFRIKKEEKERLKDICLISEKSIQQLIREKILDANCWTEKK